jgi:hypothetical protein
MISPSTPAGPVFFEVKASRQPILWAAGAYSAGIVAGVYAWRPPVWWLIALVVFIAAAAYFVLRRSGLAWVSLNLFAFEVDSLAKFSDTAALNSTFGCDMRDDLDFAMVRVRQDCRVEPRRARAHLNM